MERHLLLHTEVNAVLEDEIRASRAELAEWEARAAASRDRVAGVDALLEGLHKQESRARQQLSAMLRQEGHLRNEMSDLHQREDKLVLELRSAQTNLKQAEHEHNALQAG